MKTTLPDRDPAPIGSKSALPWYFCLAGAFLGLCFGLGILLLSTRTQSTANFRVPSGQLQADTRTVFAALHFLLDSEPAVQLNPPVVSDPLSGSVACNILGADGQPCEMLACRSNQAELNCGTSTNPPVRS